VPILSLCGYSQNRYSSTCLFFMFGSVDNLLLNLDILVSMLSALITLLSTIMFLLGAERACFFFLKLLFTSACCFFVWNSWSFSFLGLASKPIPLVIMKLCKSLDALLFCSFPYWFYVMFKLVVHSYLSSCPIADLLCSPFLVCFLSFLWPAQHRRVFLSQTS